ARVEARSFVEQEHELAQPRGDRPWSRSPTQGHSAPEEHQRGGGDPDPSQIGATPAKQSPLPERAYHPLLERWRRRELPGKCCETPRERLVEIVGHGSTLPSCGWRPSRARRLCRARESWLFDVPASMPSAAAISSWV